MTEIQQLHGTSSVLIDLNDSTDYDDDPERVFIELSDVKKGKR